jgi:nickel transport system substrate-binding protein
MNPMKLKKLFSALLSAAIIFSLAACTSPPQQHQDGQQAAVHLNIPESWGFESFYPIITPANSSSGYGITYYLTNFYDTLVQYNENDELTGALAEKWSMNADGTIYTFNLREGIKFSDGSALTADDVVASFLAVPVNLGQYNGGVRKTVYHHRGCCSER